MLFKLTCICYKLAHRIPWHEAEQHFRAAVFGAIAFCVELMVVLKHYNLPTVDLKPMFAF